MALPGHADSTERVIAAYALGRRVQKTLYKKASNVPQCAHPVSV